MPQLTVTLIGLKLGLLTGAGPDRVGLLQLDDLQRRWGASRLPLPLPVAQRLTQANLPRLAGRPRTAHKGQLYGRVLVMGGDRGFAGAGLLAAQSGATRPARAW